MEDIKKQLCEKYPFMKRNGEIYHYFNKRKVLKKNRNERLLIFMVGVQGAGKTTYCKKNFPEFETVNLDEILREYLEKHSNIPFSMEMDKKIHLIFYDNIKEKLKEGVAIVDAGVVHPAARVEMLQRLQGCYTKVILLVLNPQKQEIVRRITSQMDKRARPGLWEDVEEEYGFMQIQINENMLQMGVDEVYMI